MVERQIILGSRKSWYIAFKNSFFLSGNYHLHLGVLNSVASRFIQILRLDIWDLDPQGHLFCILL